MQNQYQGCIKMYSFFTELYIITPETGDRIEHGARARAR